jgi:glycerophosphoryl diester phosphodiesterase
MAARSGAQGSRDRVPDSGGGGKWQVVDKLCLMKTMPIAIAHRGDPIAARENTLAAFASAVRQGADMVEIDLRRTSDGEIVVLHDPTLARLWGLDRKVGELDLAAVRSLGRDEERIPTFRDVLAQVGVPLMVDFTGGDVVEGALLAAREAGAMDRSLFVSGNVKALRCLRQQAPEARIGLTWVAQDPPPPVLLEELEAEYWNPMFRLVTPERVGAVHRLGRKVSTWTVDKPRHMSRVIEAGVDAVVSNRIGELLRRLA